MSNFITPIGEQDVRTISSVQAGGVIGSVGGTPDGRIYRYALAGATTLDPGKVQIAAPAAANHLNRTGTATAVGETNVTFTLGATAATADQYRDGYLVVNASTGAGIMYRIEGHSAVASAGSITVSLSESIKVALTTSSKVSLISNQCTGLIVSSSAVAFQATGVPNVSITNANYGWVQTTGYCSVLSDGIIGKGSGAIISDAVAGAVEVEVAATVTQRVGTAVEATVDAEYRALKLSLF